MRLPPRSTSTYTHFPYTTLFRSIRRRTARRFPARRHASKEPCRLLCVDQPHGALDQPFGAEERLVGGCDHIDDGIADRKDIQRRIGHWRHSRSEEHTSELQSLMRISYAVFCLKKKTPVTYIIIQDHLRHKLQHASHKMITNR